MPKPDTPTVAPPESVTDRTQSDEAKPAKPGASTRAATAPLFFRTLWSMTTEALPSDVDTPTSWTVSPDTVTSPSDVDAVLSANTGSENARKTVASRNTRIANLRFRVELRQLYQASRPLSSWQSPSRIDARPPD